ncbi:MAG: transcriptional regulator, partial [Fibrobacter sp.]|nr:transcriptional regulator [Fibrobacter sp.]
MEKLEKIYSLHRMLSHSRYPVPLKRILDELHCSKATFYRLKA